MTSHICGRNTIVILWGNTVVLCVVKLSGKDLSRYSNKIESVGLRQCPHYRYYWKWCQNNKHFSELAPQNGEKNSWHIYNMKNFVTITLYIASKSQIPLRYLVRRWFEAGRRQVRSWSRTCRRPASSCYSLLASSMIGQISARCRSATSFEPASNQIA